MPLILPNTRICFPFKCRYCKSQVYFFQDENNGRRIFEKLGGCWSEHECPNHPDNLLNSDEFECYAQAAGRLHEKIRKEAKSKANSYQTTGGLPRSLHINPMRSRKCGEMRVDDEPYSQFEVQMLEGGKI